MGLFSAIADAFEDVVEAAADVVEDVVDAVEDVIEGAGDVVEGAVNGAGDALEGIAGAMGNAAQWAGDAAKSAGGAVGDAFEAGLELAENSGTFDAISTGTFGLVDLEYEDGRFGADVGVDGLANLSVGVGDAGFDLGVDAATMTFDLAIDHGAMSVELGAGNFGGDSTLFEAGFTVDRDGVDFDASVDPGAFADVDLDAGPLGSLQIGEGGFDLDTPVGDLRFSQSEGLDVEVGFENFEVGAHGEIDRDGDYEFGADVDLPVADASVGFDRDDGNVGLEIDGAVDVNVGLVHIEGGGGWHWEQTDGGWEAGAYLEGRVGTFGAYLEREQSVAFGAEDGDAFLQYSDEIGAGIGNWANLHVGGGFEVTTEDGGTFEAAGDAGGRLGPLEGEVGSRITSTLR